jgi:hypothetical protein
MSRRSLALPLILAALMSGCSMSDRHESGPSTASTAVGCPQLVAEIPSDLTIRKVMTAQEMGTPASVGVIWSNPAGSRVINVSSAPTDEEFGDGTSAVPKKRQVQGRAATEVTVGDVHRVIWHQPQAPNPCGYWTVVTQGLTAQELEAVLSTVREA